MKPVSISIIIPVYNEAGIINDSIDHIQTELCAGYDAEIIVVDGNPQQNTLHAIKDPAVFRLSSSPGRGIQMNKGVSAARGDVLLFLHADTKLVEQSFRLITHAVNQRHVVGGAFNLGIQSDKPIYRLIEKTVALRTRLTRIPYGDQAIFFKRHFFTDCGGFKDIPIMEDVELMQRIRKSGRKIHIIENKCRTSSRRWESEGVFFCTIRNTILLTLYRAGVSPFFLYKFYSR